ncbi:MAG: ABC-2 transporter permease, partial [Clostridiales bacterium]|nr:ABC-2 transporter permease [Clostridiales bacterium]
MKGLIIKDFINLKKSLKMFLIMSVLYFFIAINTDNPYFFTSMLTVLLAITTVSLFAYDDMAKWDVFALTMP